MKYIKSKKLLILHTHSGLKRAYVALKHYTYIPEHSDGKSYTRFQNAWASSMEVDDVIDVLTQTINKLWESHQETLRPEQRKQRKQYESTGT